MLSKIKALYDSTPLLSDIDNIEATEEAFKLLKSFIDTFQKQVPLEIVSEDIGEVSKVSMFARAQGFEFLRAYQFNRDLKQIYCGKHTL